MKKKFNKTDLPHELPVFPLSNAIFFPKTLIGKIANGKITIVMHANFQFW